MLALRSHAAGGPETLSLDTIPDPVPGSGEVVIAVETVALNYPDTLFIRDLYQARPPRPFAPGSEAVGIVAAVGPDVGTLQPGDRVIATVAWGALVEKLCVAETACIPISEAADAGEAAALMVTYSTSLYALREVAQIQPSERLVVLGASGGVGIAAVQIGRALGAHVVAAVSTQQKADAAGDSGANTAIVYPPALDDRDAARAFTAMVKDACPEGEADVVLDPVGGNYSEPAFRALGWRGRHLVVGFTAGIARLPLNLPLLKGASVMGVFYGDFTRRESDRCRALQADVIAMHAAGSIKPRISRRIPLARAAEGFEALERREADGKIVITI